MISKNTPSAIIKKNGLMNILGSIPTLWDNLFVYLFLKKPKKGPLFVSWDIISKCNFSCSYCYRDKVRQKILPTKDMIKIVKQLGKSGVKMLSICGGEPLLFDDLTLIIQEAKKQKMNVNISTNGFLLKKFVRKLIDSGLDSIIISAESHKRDVHDSIREEGSFKSILDGIEEIKKERRNKRPFIGIRTVINNRTFYDLHDFVSYWDTKVDEILFQPIHSNPNLTFIIPKNMQFKQNEEAEHRKYFLKLLKKFKFLDNPYNREIPSFLFDKHKLQKKLNCFAGFFFIDIDCKGNVYPCGGHYVSVGNLREKSLSEIWSNEKINSFRRTIKFTENTCDCWLNCSMLNIYLTKLLKWFGKNDNYIHKS